jgi:outer membrane lipoprotein SlyB
VKKYAMIGAGGVVGSIGGMAAGFAAGSIIFPGIGSIVGAVVGAVGGGIAGQKIGLKQYEKLDKQLEMTKARDASLKVHMEQEEIRYQEAMFMLGVHE